MNNLTQSGCPNKASQPALDSELDQLQRMISTLEESLAMLSNRLELALLPPTPATPDPANAPAPSSPNHYCGRVAELRNRVHTLRTCIETLTSRLAV